MTTTLKRNAAIAVLALGAGWAGAQTTPASPTTPSSLPPGATSTTGNKAATPASGAMQPGMGASGAMPADPATGSTPGMPPGAKSTKGDKAMTPKSGAKPASSSM